MKKILIANRGEIAVRLVRACRDYGIRSVAVYADQDAEALYVQLADEAYALPGTSAAHTYLNSNKLIEIANRSAADAVHPGYGFLSESAEFARAVIAAGLTWIGPPPQVIEVLGNKVSARKIAKRIRAPLAVGSDGPVANSTEVLRFARAHGLPLAIKAVYGGGGRGMKVVRTMDQVIDFYDSAVREATAAFGRGECFLERFLDRPRHIEAQVLADQQGSIVVVGTRDCTLQRRNQKLIEEAPAPFLADHTRTRIIDAARKICAAAGYISAGTVEFLLGADGTLSFLEVNTRLQVEHPVTEESAGIDLVIEQFRIAEGLPLSITETPQPRLHAMEFRINAEDPARGFLPTPGVITTFSPPTGPGIRLDSGVTAGSSVPGAFDSLLAKLIVTGACRQQVLARAQRALREFHIEGLATVLPFHRAVLESADFTSAYNFNVHTRWIETDFAATLEAQMRPLPTASTGLLRTAIEIDGKRVGLGISRTLLAGIALHGQASAPDSAQAPATPTATITPDTHAIAAPFSGTLLSYKVHDGEVVAAGSLIAIMEAMKMETQITAPRTGKILHCAIEGTFQAAGAEICRYANEDE